MHHIFSIVIKPFDAIAKHVKHAFVFALQTKKTINNCGRHSAVRSISIRLTTAEWDKSSGKESLVFSCLCKCLWCNQPRKMRGEAFKCHLKYARRAINITTHSRSFSFYTAEWVIFACNMDYLCLYAYLLNGQVFNFDRDSVCNCAFSFERHYLTALDFETAKLCRRPRLENRINFRCAACFFLSVAHFSFEQKPST